MTTPIGWIERGLEVISNPIWEEVGNWDSLWRPSSVRPSQDLRVRRAIKPNRSGRGNEVREGQRRRCRGGLSRCRGAQNQTQGRQWASIRPRGADDGLPESSFQTDQLTKVERLGVAHLWIYCWEETHQSSKSPDAGVVNFWVSYKGCHTWRILARSWPSYKIMETFGVNWTGPLKAFVGPREVGVH